MTTLELHFDFNFKVDKVATLSKEDFTLGEVDWLLNEAQNLLVKRYYTGNNTSNTAFETTQKRIDDLSSLVVKYPEQPELLPSLLDGGVYEIPLNDLVYEYWFFIRGNIKVFKLTGDMTCVKDATMKLISHDDLNRALEDPFNNTDMSEVLFNFGRSTEIISSDYSRSSIYLYPGIYGLGPVKIEYIKKPARINYGGYVYIDGITYSSQSSELPDHLHSEIVDLAVQVASGLIESPEYIQLKAQKVFANE